MNLTQEHIDFENHCKQIIGLKLYSVDYYEIKYNPGNPTRNYKTRYVEIDSVDYSIVLHSETENVEICWDDQFYQFGVGLRINENSQFDGYQIWNMNDSEIWSDFIGEQILDLNITWETITTTEENTHKKKETIYPQDMTVVFSNNKKIYISAAEFLNSNDVEVFGPLDNLTVTNNESIAKQVKMII